MLWHYKPVKAQDNSFFSYYLCFPGSNQRLPLNGALRADPGINKDKEKKESVEQSLIGFHQMTVLQ
jgi:hypothetical protein